VTDTALLVDSRLDLPAAPSQARRRLLSRAVAVAAVGALGAMHFALDGLTSILVALQPVLADRTGARPATLGLVVAIGLASASLLQPLAARLVHRYGERLVAVTGAMMAALGYGLIPATGSVAQTVAAVVAGGIGSALFHPAAGALVARTAGAGRETLPLAAFSAVGTAGAALVPVVVLTSVESLGWAAAAPVAAALLALTVATRALVLGKQPHTAAGPATPRPAGGSVRLVVLTAALIALGGITVGASAPLLLAASYGSAHPAVAWIVATYSASGAVGGIALALWSRRTGVRAVLIPALSAGAAAAAALPFVPGPLMFPAMVVAGVGLSGSLPLLVAHARRPGETSAAGAVGRVLGLGVGLGGAGYAAVGVLQTVLGYGAALTATALVTGAAVVVAVWFICPSVDPSDCTDSLRRAATTCPCG